MRFARLIPACLPLRRAGACLSVSVALALPLGLAPVTGAAAGVAPIGLISSSSWAEPYPGGKQTVHIVGQVHNNSGGNVTAVKIPISLKDGSGAVIDSTPWTFATVNVLQSGEDSPFELTLTPAPDAYAGYSIGAISYAPSSSQPYHAGLATTIDPCSAGDPAGEICGTVTNEGSVSVDNVRAVLTFLDGSNTTVAQDEAWIDDGRGSASLAPSGSSTFRLDRTGDPQGSSVVVLSEPTYPVDLNPAQLDFGSTRVGSASSGQPVTVFNGGTRNLTVASVSANPGPEFAASSNCGVILPNSSCTITVSFTPAQAGIRSGVLSVQDDAAGSAQTIPLVGKGSLPQVVLSPASVQFGDVIEGGTATRTVDLANAGDAVLDINSISADDSSNFRVDASKCPAVLSPAAHCLITVSFSPVEAGTVNGNLVLSDDAPSATQHVSLSGNGTGPGAAFDQSSLDFGSRPLETTSPSKAVTLTNTGTEDLLISSPVVTGDFELTTPCSTNPLPHGQSCTIGISFTPTQSGNRTGSLTINDNTFVGHHSVALTGSGAQATLVLNPTALDFGTRALGTTTTLTDTLTNQGNGDLVISKISASPEYSTSGCGPLPLTVHANQSCTLSVSFKPTGLGTRNGSISLTDNTPAGRDILQLTGNVQAFMAMYTLDGYGGLHADGGSPAMAATAYWSGWKIARGAALLPDGTGGYVLDGFGGLHKFGSAAPESASSYFGWDIARDVALLTSSTPTQPKGYTLDGYGGIHPFGGAPAAKGYPYFAGRDIVIKIVLLSDGSGGYTLDAFGGLHPFAIGSGAPAPSIANNSQWPGWRIVRGVALNPNSSAAGASGVTLDAYGGVHPFNSGGAAGTVSPAGPYFGWDIARAVVLGQGSTSARPQGWVLDGWGGLHAFGGAPEVASGAYWPRFDIAVDLIVS